MSEKSTDVRTSYTTNEERRLKMDAPVKRGSAFTELKNMAVAKDCIAVSENAIFGTDRKGDVLFRAVEVQYFTKFIPTGRPFRTVVSMKKPANLIIKSCSVRLLPRALPG